MWGVKEALARGKGVTGNGESEGSPRQSPELNESEPDVDINSKIRKTPAENVKKHQEEL